MIVAGPLEEEKPSMMSLKRTFLVPEIEDSAGSWTEPLDSALDQKKCYLLGINLFIGVSSSFIASILYSYIAFDL